jgi:hypothetical protein
MNYCRVNNVKAVLASIDQSKAFDSVDHSFMEKVYDFFGFGARIKRWLKSIGTGRLACIQLGRRRTGPPPWRQFIASSSFTMVMMMTATAPLGDGLTIALRQPRGRAVPTTRSVSMAPGAPPFVASTFAWSRSAAATAGQNGPCSQEAASSVHHPKQQGYLINNRQKKKQSVGLASV